MENNSEWGAPKGQEFSYIFSHLCIAENIHCALEVTGIVRARCIN